MKKSMKMIFMNWGGIKTTLTIPRRIQMTKDDMTKLIEELMPGLDVTFQGMIPTDTSSIDDIMDLNFPEGYTSTDTDGQIIINTGLFT
jgi:hypothetical protein